jgi:peroxiredoxin
MLSAGDAVPEATVWTAPNELRKIADVVGDGPVLLLFYLFDWSST